MPQQLEGAGSELLGKVGEIFRKCYAVSGKYFEGKREAAFERSFELCATGVFLGLGQILAGDAFEIIPRGIIEPASEGVLDAVGVKKLAMDNGDRFQQQVLHGSDTLFYMAQLAKINAHGCESPYFCWAALSDVFRSIQAAAYEENAWGKSK
jgi:hypothetical protein